MTRHREHVLGLLTAAALAVMAVFMGLGPVSASDDGTAPSSGPVEWVSPEGVTIVIDSAGGWTVEQIYQLLVENARDLDLVGPTLTIKVQDVNLSSTTAGATSVGGVYSNFSATMHLKGVDSSFVDKPDAILAHEYGHAWSLYHLYLVHQKDWTPWLEFRGIAGDPRLDSTYPWSKSEMIAEDYRLLFSSPAALAQWPGQMNSDIPDAREVPGLADFLRSVWAGQPDGGVNTAPVVSAAGPGSVVLSAGAALDGTVADDGLPGPYSVAWSQASGPGTVTFADSAAEDTTASFSAPGTYVVTLTAHDGELSGADSVTITVDDDPPPPPPPPVNTAPVVTASGPASVVKSDGAALDGTVADDGLPGPYSVAWSQSSGPGTVTFADSAAEDTTASFSAPGTYVVTLTADDGELTGADSVTITVDDDPPPPPPPPVNTAPVVTASGPASVVKSDGAALDGTVADDGLPAPYTVAWSQSSGPGTVTFADAAAEDTTASFSAPGTYVVTLTADDGELTDADSVTITVEDDPPPAPTATTEIFEGSLNKKWPARTFETSVAQGPADAVLTFGGRRGKKAAQQQLTLTVYDAAGSLVATATDASPVTLSVGLAAGTYTWEVTGGRTSFSLEVTYLAP